MRTNSPILFLVAFGIITLWQNCSWDKKKGNDYPSSLFSLPATVTLNTDSGYSINPVTGDSIKSIKNSKGENVKTGVQLSLTGKIIDTLITPKILPVTISTVEAPLPNVSSLPTKITVIPIDESKLKKIIAGANIDTSWAAPVDFNGKSIPTGVATPASGKIVRCKIPKPVTALPLSPAGNSIYNIKHLNAYHGLTFPVINSVLEDRNGNIWIAGWEGLSCYNGQTVRHFTKKEGLIKNSIYYILEDRDGNLWIDYGVGNVSKFDGVNFTHFTFFNNSQSIPMGNNFIMEDGSGNIWFRTLIQGLSRFDGKSFTHLTMREGLITNNIRCMMEDSKGNVWFGTRGGGAGRYDGKSFTYFRKKDGLNHDVVSAIFEDAKGNIWFGTDSGAARYDGKYITQFTQNEGLSGNGVGSIVQDDYGIMYFGTYGNGVTLFDGNVFSRITEKEGLSSNFISTMMKDRKGNIWVCTSKGLSIYKKENYLRLTERTGPFNFDIVSIIADRNANLWFGTIKEGVFFYDGRSLKQHKWDEGRKITSIISSMLQDSKGNLWIASSTGIYKYDGKKILHFSGNGFIIPDLTRAILEDKEGNIWLGGVNGLIKYDGKNFTRFTHEGGLSSSDVTSLFEDGKGRIWIGTYEGGISIHEKGKIIHFTEKEGLLNNEVRSVIEDSSGNIWISYFKGLSRFDGKSFTHFTEKEGFTDRWVVSIFFDRYNSLWAATNKGLYGFPGYQGNTPLAPTEDILPGIVNYGENDGFKSIYINGRLDNKNRLWLTQTYEPGLTIVDMNRFSYKPDSPLVYLDHIYINGNFIDYNDSVNKSELGLKSGRDERFKYLPKDLELKHDHSWLTFYFHANDQFADDLVKYSFKLDGLDKHWSIPSPEARAEYRYIPPGNYTFKVRAMNKYQVWGQELEFRFIILPPVWQRWWFWTLVGLIALGIVAWSVQKRVNSIRKRENEKTESVRRMAELELQSLRAQLNPHFMFNSLNAIQELILKEEIEKSQSYLARFAKLLRMLLENADKPFIPLQREIDFLQLYLSLEKLRIPDLQFSIDVDETVDTALTKIPNMILQPYIENAIWHGLSHKENDKQVQIRIDKINGVTRYEIEDNGVGRQKAAELKSLYRREHKSKGMELLSKRFKLLAKEYGSEVETSVTDITNGQASGTIVTIKVPDKF